MGRVRASAFAAGEKVTIQYHELVTAITTVAKPGYYKMVLANGTEWRGDGARPYGYASSWYDGPFVRKWEEGDEAKLQYRLDFDLVDRFPWKKMSPENLHEIAQIVRRWISRRTA